MDSFALPLPTPRLSICRTLARDVYLEAMRRSHVSLNPEIYAHLPDLEVGDDQILLDIVHREKSDLLGGLSLILRDESARSWEIGYWIVPEASGQGYVTEAAGALIGELFLRFRAKRIQLNCDARNRGSIRVAQRLGFHAEALWTGVDRSTGKPAKRLVFALYHRDDRCLPGQDADAQDEVCRGYPL